MIKKFALLILLAFTFLTSQAGLTANYGKVPDAYNFWFYTPENTATKKPLVIFLHGSSLCGSDLNRVRRYGTIDAIEKGRQLDAYVIAPQNCGGAWKPSKIMNIVDWAQKNHNIDTDRIYVLGMSLGGYGTIDLAATYPDRIAAAMALCGGGTAKNLGALNKIPLWIVHGTADRAVSISQSDRVVASMRSVDPNTPRLIYNRIPGMNHSQPARMFYLQDTYDWLFSHSLNDPGRKVNDSFSVSGDLLRGAYKDLNTRRAYSPSHKGYVKKSSKKSKSYGYRSGRKKSKRRR